MTKKHTSLPTMIGASSLLVIFAVLCLTVFALLAISTVQANQRLSQQTISAVTGYYAADCQAEALLARLRDGELPPDVTEENGVYSYACPISETQVLMVEVTLEGSSYQILRWQAVSTAQWQTDDQLQLWDGESR